MCSTNTLRYFCMVIGAIFSIVSMIGLCLSLYLTFGDPIRKFARDTYSPSWEDIGPAMACSVLSLLANVMLIGGARQHLRYYLLGWILWKIALVLIFWAWFGYNYLKYQGYVTGLKGCYFCGLNPEEMSVTFGGILCSVVLMLTMMPVCILRGRFNKQHRLRKHGGSVVHFNDSRQYLAGSPPHHYQELTPFQKSVNDLQSSQPSSLQSQHQMYVQQYQYPQQLQLRDLQQQQQLQLQQQQQLQQYSQFMTPEQMAQQQMIFMQQQQQLQQQQFIHNSQYNLNNLHLQQQQQPTQQQYHSQQQLQQYPNQQLQQQDLTQSGGQQQQQQQPESYPNLLQYFTQT